jgi:hypothetical protein
MPVIEFVARKRHAHQHLSAHAAPPAERSRPRIDLYEYSSESIRAQQINRPSFPRSFSNS